MNVHVYSINDALASVWDGSAFVELCADEPCETLVVVLHPPRVRCFPEQDCDCDDRPARAVYPPGAVVRSDAAYCPEHAHDARSQTSVPPNPSEEQ